MLVKESKRTVCCAKFSVRDVWWNESCQSQILVYLLSTDAYCRKKNQISGFVPLMVLANAKLIFITIFSTFRNDFKEEDAFVSFNDDTCASIVIQLLQTGHYDHKQVSKTFKKMKNSYVKPHGMNQYHCTLALKWLWINAFVLSWFFCFVSL